MSSPDEAAIERLRTFISLAGDELEGGDEAMQTFEAWLSAQEELLEMAIWAEAAIAPFSKDPQERSGISRLRAAISKARGGA